EREVAFQRGEIEAVRRRTGLVEEVDADDRVHLVDVPIPERPCELLQPPPRDDREHVGVVADDVHRMAAPRSRLCGAVEPARPVPDRLALRGHRELDSDVEAAEEERGGADELVVPDRHARERADAMPADPVLAPVDEDVELDGALFAGRGIDLLHVVERLEHRALAHLDGGFPDGCRPGLDHVRSRGGRAVADVRSSSAGGEGSFERSTYRGSGSVRTSIRGGSFPSLTCVAIGVVVAIAPPRCRGAAAYADNATPSWRRPQAHDSRRAAGRIGRPRSAMLLLVPSFERRQSWFSERKCDLSGLSECWPDSRTS